MNIMYMIIFFICKAPDGPCMSCKHNRGCFFLNSTGVKLNQNKTHNIKDFPYGPPVSTLYQLHI